VGQLASAFAAWADASLRAKALVRTAVRAWQAASATQVRRREQLIRFFTRKALGLLRLAYSEWRGLVARKRMLSLLSGQMDAARRRRQLGRLLAAWHRLAGQLALLRSSLDASSAAQGALLLRRAFLTWWRHVRKLAAARATAESRWLAARRGMLGPLMAAWRGVAADAKAADSRLRRALVKLGLRTAGQVFAAWRAAAAVMKAARAEAESIRRSTMRPLLSRSFYGWLYLLTGMVARKAVVPPRKPVVKEFTPAPTLAPAPEPAPPPKKSADSQTPAEPAPKPWRVVPVTTTYVTSPPRYGQAGLNSSFDSSAGSPATGHQHQHHHHTAASFHAERSGQEPVYGLDPYGGIPAPTSAVAPAQLFSSTTSLRSRHGHSAAAAHSSANASAGGRPSSSRMLHGAYEKVLQECASLEQKVLELEHQRQLEQVSYELHSGRAAGGPSTVDNPLYNFSAF